MKINICKTPNREALSSLNEQQRLVLHHLHDGLSRAEWSADGITTAFKAAGEAAQTGMRDVYRACYALFMATERGPRLAPILSNCDRKAILDLVEDALDA
jgi:lysyl-tRNA synthetase class I